MIVNGQRVDLEVQVDIESDYADRSLYYWARDYSTALGEGEKYSTLPRVVVISIMDFKLFKCERVHSEFQLLEVTRYERLTDKMCLHYFELPKLKKSMTKDDKVNLWLALFKAKTEEELKQIEALEVSTMKEAIKAYHSITASAEFKEIERLRSLARHNEASALDNARRKAEEAEREKWQGVVAEKDEALAEKDAVLVEKDAEIAKLEALVEKLKKHYGEYN